eukprot:11764343-Alexandrium_andersonii.AAC.1
MPSFLRASAGLLALARLPGPGVSLTFEPYSSQADDRCCLCWSAICSCRPCASLLVAHAGHPALTSGRKGSLLHCAAPAGFCLLSTS